MVKAGKLESRWGKVFDRIFENRQSADYVELCEFAVDQVDEIVLGAGGFVLEMQRLLADANKE